MGSGDGAPDAHDCEALLIGYNLFEAASDDLNSLAPIMKQCDLLATTGESICEGWEVMVAAPALTTDDHPDGVGSERIFMRILWEEDVSHLSALKQKAWTLTRRHPRRHWGATGGPATGGAGDWWAGDSSGES